MIQITITPPEERTDATTDAITVPRIRTDPREIRETMLHAVTDLLRRAETIVS